MYKVKTYKVDSRLPYAHLVSRILIYCKLQNLERGALMKLDEFNEKALQRMHLELKDEYWKVKRVTQEEEEEEKEEEEVEVEAKSAEESKASSSSESDYKDSSPSPPPFAQPQTLAPQTSELAPNLHLPTDLITLYQNLHHLHLATRNKVKQDTTNLSHLIIEMIELFTDRFDTIAKGTNTLHQHMNHSASPPVPPFTFPLQLKAIPPTVAAAETSHKSLAPDEAGLSKTKSSSPFDNLGPALDYGMEEQYEEELAVAPEPIEEIPPAIAPISEVEMLAATQEGKEQVEEEMLTTQEEMSSSQPLLALNFHLLRTWRGVLCPGV